MMNVKYCFEPNRWFHWIGLILMMTIPNVSTAADLTLLFMGDNGHHQPARRFSELAPAMMKRGIQMKYTDRMEDLTEQNLAQYDGLVLYANIDEISPEQAKSVLDFVASGKGFIPLHCATYCWRNSDEMVALMGGQFLRHGGQVFSTEIAAPEHPVMQGFQGFSSWDETYIHHLHNEAGRTVLEYRAEGEQAEGRDREPWTWVKTYGEGRVFYTAWGHDQRTFSNPGYHNLVERGIRWACGDDPAVVPPFQKGREFELPEMTELRSDVAEFEYVDVGPKIPNYTPGESWGEQGEPKNLMQKPLTVEESMKHFVTPKDMAVRHYANEEHFEAKPIAMTWDGRGRLWICETVDYPNELGTNRDRIRICEDTDGDLVADKFTVFAEGLSIPTAIVIARGGAVVQNGTETIFLKDTDGDDVADVKETLISNWALGDTHGGVSNFRYGLDNWIWAMQGYNNSAPRFDGKRAQRFRQGFWRFKLSDESIPKVTDLEFVRSTDNNTWGLGISEEGLIFGSTANRNPSTFMPIANRYYEQVRGWAPRTLRTIADTFKFEPITDKVRQVDQFGGYTAGAGHALYTARTFPQDWWNQTAFVCGPTGHLVGTFVLSRDGAGYQSTSPLNLLASDDEWSAPIMAEVGPDGAVWVIDWYNYIVQHNPTPNGFKTGKGAAYESDLRDKKRGRIYRVVPTQQSTDVVHAFSDLSQASNDSLVQALAHPAMVWRLHAQRLLIEKNAVDQAANLMEMVGNRSLDAAGLNVGAIHALRTLDGLGLIPQSGELSAEIAAALKAGLQHPSAGVQMNAVSVLPNSEAGAALLAEHSALLSSSDAQVQLHAILKVADLPSSDWAGGIVAELANFESDRIIVEALTSAAATHAIGYLSALTAMQVETVTAANRVIASRVAEHIARGRPSADELEAIVAGLGSADASYAQAILDGLANGLPNDYELEASESLDAALLAAFENAEADTRTKLIQLAVNCGSKALDARVEEMVDLLVDGLNDYDASDAARVKIANDLVGLVASDIEAVEEIAAQINAQTSPETARQFLAAIQKSTADEAGEVIVESMESLTPQLKSAAVDTLMTKPGWTANLLEALESGDLLLADLSLEQKQALRAYPNEELKAKADKLLAMDGGLPDADREKVLQSLIHVTEEKGDIENGKLVFKKVCSACHKHGEMGNEIGPNLTGMAVHPKEELLTHIIDPSRNVEGNYRLYQVLTVDGSVLSGMLAGESRTSITIIDSQAKEMSLPREDIERLIASRKSVMPEGFEKQVSEKELTDLLEFLTDKGAYLPISLDRYATAISTKGLFSEGDNGPDRMVFEDWGPKTFKGVPFLLTDPQDKTRRNIILLNGPYGTLPPSMPKSVELPCNTPAKAIHMLGGVGGWSYPYSNRQTVSMIVRLHYADGQKEDHELVNGVHIADYIRRADVPKSEFAFELGSQQLRYLSLMPERDAKIETIELVKGGDISAPMVMAVTVELPAGE